jgi:hypothetical protein
MQIKIPATELEKKKLNDWMNKLGINHPHTLGYSLASLFRRERPDTLEKWDDIVRQKTDFQFHANRLSIASGEAYFKCLWYLEDLFINKTYHALRYEVEVFEFMSKMGRIVRWANPDEELCYAIDIIVDNYYGIQVKPDSYREPKIEAHMETKKTNIIKNQRWCGPVFYVYYSNDGVDYSDLLRQLDDYELGKPKPEKKEPTNLIDFM